MMKKDEREEQQLAQLLNSHPLLQALLQRHDRLLKTFASASSDGSLLLLLPLSTTLEAYAAAEPLHQQLLQETHLYKATALPHHFINLRGQSIQRCGQHLYLELGFSSPRRHVILAEEEMYSSGVHLLCLLIPESLLFEEGEAGAAAAGGREGGRSAVVEAEAAAAAGRGSSETRKEDKQQQQQQQGLVGTTPFRSEGASVAYAGTAAEAAAERKIGEREEEQNKTQEGGEEEAQQQQFRRSNRPSAEEEGGGAAAAAAAARAAQLLLLQEEKSRFSFTTWQQQQQQKDLLQREQHMQEMLAAEREIQETVFCWWADEGLKAPLPSPIRRDIYLFIQNFKDSYILALGCETQIVARLHELTGACSRQVSMLLLQQRQQQQALQQQQQQQQHGRSSHAAAAAGGGSGAAAATAAGGGAGGGGGGAAAAALAAAAAVARPAAAVAAVRQLARRGAAAAGGRGASSSSGNADYTDATAAPSPAKLSPFIERLVYIQLHEMLWGFAVDALQRRQEKLQRRLRLLKKQLGFVKENLRLQPSLQEVSLEGPAVLLDQMSSLKLPEHKIDCLRSTVQAIQQACRIHVASTQSRRQQQQQQHRHRHQRRQQQQQQTTAAASLAGQPHEAPAYTSAEPVEISADDLVALLLITVILSSGRLILANYWFASLFILKESKAAQYTEGSFYLTNLYSALSVALQLRPVPRRPF